MALPVPDHRELRTGSLMSIIRQSGPRSGSDGADALRPASHRLSPLRGSAGSRFDSPYLRDVHRALGDRQVVTALQIDPETPAIAEQLA